MKNIYGNCCICETPLEPIWFTEEEYTKEHSKTGRKRTACSHLACPNCFHVEAVDDTFDGPWRSPL